jgi:hypothetical protein
MPMKLSVWAGRQCNKTPRPVSPDGSPVRSSRGFHRMVLFASSFKGDKLLDEWASNDLHRTVP